MPDKDYLETMKKWEKVLTPEKDIKEAELENTALKDLLGDIKPKKSNAEVIGGVLSERLAMIEESE